MRLQLRKAWALLVIKERYSFGPGVVQHGPQTWPWWRLCSWAVACTDPYPPSSAWNVWLYSRWGAHVWHVAIDRRTPQQRGIK